MKRMLLSGLLLALPGLCLGQAANKPFLFQKPTVSKTHIVFTYGGDLWIVERNGGDAKRLTTHVGIETNPIFSPDGTQVAFTGSYDGNTDIFTIPASGGVPKRLTWHPGVDEVVNWTPDGKRLLFRSGRDSNTPVPRLFTIALDSGFPDPLPLPYAMEGSYTADGKRLAYVPTAQWQRAWKRYRGGQTTPIWLVDLNSLKIEKVPRSNTNDAAPVWFGDKVYFLSDRNGPVSLFAYDTKSKKVTQAVKNDGLDIKSVSGGPDALVYEQFGTIYLLDPTTNQSKKINIRLAGDLPEVRPHYVKAAAYVQNFGISPTGARTVFEARGEILTVPAEKGDIRNLTQSAGVMERDPAWSPDGKWVAYFSDETGEYALHLKDQSGKGETKKITLDSKPSFYYTPVWSPDSKKITLTDRFLNFWVVDIEKAGMPIKVDTDLYETPFGLAPPSWSPDSKWLTYARQLPSHLRAIFVYDVATQKSHQVTDGLSDAVFPCFDRSGKYLYFAASTDAGPTAGWLDMSSINRPVTRSAYVVVLRKEDPSPLAPESDEEKPKEEKQTTDAKPGDKPADKPAEPAKPKEGETRIDLENIGQRILALPIPARNFAALTTGKANTLFLLEGPPIAQGFGGGGGTLSKFDLTARKLDVFLPGISNFVVSANGEKLLYQQGPRYAITPTAAANPAAGTLSLTSMEVYSDPQAEWKQMYKEAWRITRDFMYDPNLHGLNLPTVMKRYEPYLDNIASRADLNYLFEEMLGETTLGHTFINGGDMPQPEQVRGGLLGADYKIENGRYRFARIYNGENWNPNLRAPLTQPGVNVKEGEYLIAVNGREVRAPESVYKFFEATAGKQTLLKVSTNADGSNAREVTVVPIDSENGLRNRAWIEDNRRKVEKLSNGRLAYVYLPDTAGGGYTNFNRYYFAQVGKEGAVIDERFNGGGLIADYIIDYMRRPLMAFFTNRAGQDYMSPVGSIYGPKAMIINEYAGSGGDAMPWMFRKAKIGPLIGKRTWGGLVGIFGYPPLMDGGGVTAPRTAFWNPDGTWDVENHGVDPDVEVEMEPAAWRDGHDPQLEKAVEVVMEELKKNPLPKYKKPAYPNYHSKAK